MGRIYQARFQSIKIKTREIQVVGAPNGKAESKDGLSVELMKLEPTNFAKLLETTPLKFGEIGGILDSWQTEIFVSM